MSNKKIKKVGIANGKRIKVREDIDSINYNDYVPAFSFLYAQDNYCLSQWESKDIKKLIDRLAKFETKKWSEIHTQSVYQFSKVDKNGLSIKIPNEITDDTNIYYFKPFGQNTPFRVFGIKERHNFKFLWFDKKHEVYSGN